MINPDPFFVDIHWFVRYQWFFPFFSLPRKFLLRVFLYLNHYICASVASSTNQLFTCYPANRQDNHTNLNHACFWVPLFWFNIPSHPKISGCSSQCGEKAEARTAWSQLSKESELVVDVTRYFRSLLFHHFLFFWFSFSFRRLDQILLSYCFSLTWHGVTPS